MEKHSDRTAKQEYQENAQEVLQQKQSNDIEGKLGNSAVHESENLTFLTTTNGYYYSMITGGLVNQLF